MEQKVEKTENLENGAGQPDEAFELMMWANEHARQLITAAVVLLAVAAIAGGWVFYKQSREQSAESAISMIRPSAAGDTSGAEATAYLKIADDYSGTKAAERALVEAGGLLFEAGKFDAASAAFGRYLGQYAGGSLTSRALLGIAACLEAGGKTADAAAKYKDLLAHPDSDSILPQARSALARCYVELNKPEQAFEVYQTMLRQGANDTWTMEANNQIHELVEKHPELVKPAPAPSFTTPTVPSVPAAPTATVPKAPAPKAGTNK